MNTPAESSSRLLPALSLRLLDSVNRVVADLVDTILKADASVYAERGEETVNDLRVAAQREVESVLQVLAGRVPAGTDPYEAAVTTGRRQVQQDLPLEGALRGYRMLGQLLWTQLVQAARSGDDVVDPARLLDEATDVWRVIDEFSSATSEAYRAEELLLRQRDLRLQGAILDALADGRGADPDFARDAARSLAIPLEVPKLCVVALAEVVGGEPLPRAQEVLADEGIASVWQTRQSSEIGLVALGRHSPTAVRSWLGPHVASRAGTSPVFYDLAWMTTAYRLADAAARTLRRDSRSMTGLDERLPHALLVESPHITERLLANTVGPLLELPDDDAKALLATLRSYLENNAEVTATAAELYCHRNTITYRLSRIEKLTGRGTAKLSDRVLWSLAVLALDQQSDR